MKNGITGILRSDEEGLFLRRCMKRMETRTCAIPLLGRFFAAGDNRDLTERVTELSVWRKTLSSDLRALEGHFLSINGSLEKLFDGSLKVIEQGEVLMGLSQGEAGAEGIVTRISDSVSPLLTFFGECGARAEKNVGELQSYGTNIKSSLQLDKRLEQTISQLTFVRTLFCVESASLDSQRQIMFQSLVEGMRRLQTQVTETFHNQFNEFAAAAVTISELGKNLESQASCQRSFLEEGNRELLEMLGSIAKIQSENAGRETSLHDSARSISDDTSKMVMAMQFQDIVDQKLQHVFETVSEIEETFTTLSKLRNRAERGQAFRFIEKASVVVANQIETAREEIRNSLYSLEKGFQDVVGLTGENRLVLEDAFELAESMIESLLGVFPRISILVTDSVDRVSSIVDRIAPINKLTSSFSQLIGEMSCQLHLIGLNAEVQAAKVDEGTGLEILSAKTSVISVETREICERIALELDSLAAGLKAVFGEFEKLLKDGQEHKAHLVDQAEAERVQAVRYGVRYKEAVDELLAVMDGFERLTGPAVKAMKVELPIMKSLDGLERCARLTGDRAKGMADRLGAEESDEKMTEKIFERYTMVSERDVHRRSIEKKGALPTEPNFRRGGEDVDLFDSDFKGAATDSEAGSVELF